jgi:threonine dehydrogenase-like Zn-dependent dehydrogenase
MRAAIFKEPRSRSTGRHVATGHHAAECGGVPPGTTVAVVGDGAGGLSAGLAANRLGAERIIALSRHPQRHQLAREFGATDIVSHRGEDAIDTSAYLTASSCPS